MNEHARTSEGTSAHGQWSSVVGHTLTVFVSKRKKRHRERQEERGHFFKSRREERGGLCPGAGPPGPAPGPQGLRRVGGWAAPPGAARPPTTQAGTDVTTPPGRTTVRQRSQTEEPATGRGPGHTERPGGPNRGGGGGGPATVWPPEHEQGKHNAFRPHAGQGTRKIWFSFLRVP